MTFLTSALIFLSRVVDVSLATFRTLMIVQGRKLHAALFGVFEVAIYILALGKVVDSLDNPWNFIAYCLGFAAGNYVGIMLEGRLALGMLSARVTVSASVSDELIANLRANDYGVTVIDARGKDGPRKILSIVFNRKDLRRLEELVKEFDQSAFMVVNNISPIYGGYIRQGLKK